MTLTPCYDPTVDAIPRSTRFTAHGLPLTDVQAEIVMRTRLVFSGVQETENAIFDLVHFILATVPTEDGEESGGIFRTFIRVWRN